MPASGGGWRRFNRFTQTGSFVYSFGLHANRSSEWEGALSRQQIEDFPTPLPPLAEQYRIVARVGELMALCVEFENKLFSSASRYRKLTEAALYNALSS
jgi:restriction endonuclease S subunit